MARIQPMIHSITIDELLQDRQPVCLVDVRTPAEFEHGHIPGAVNLPLFTNEERVQVGTTYKQVGREAAILLGFELTGNKWAGFIRQALAIAPDKKIALHCWRGGMRSGAMAWALDLYGFDVYLLQGGYKSYRRRILRQFEMRYRMLIIGGMTGSGKTKMLHQLRHLQQQVIDLEELAQHQGSSYGTLNRLVQPTQEQFENNLGRQLIALDLQQPVWIEDEGISIGKRFVPKPFWDQMQRAVLLELQVHQDQRIEYLLTEYGSLDKNFLVECTERIHKRLGPLQTKQAVTAIRENRMQDFISVLLWYYDKSYAKQLTKKNPAQVVPVLIESNDDTQNARQVIELVRSKSLPDL